MQRCQDWISPLRVHRRMSMGSGLDRILRRVVMWIDCIVIGVSRRCGGMDHRRCSYRSQWWLGDDDCYICTWTWYCSWRCPVRKFSRILLLSLQDVWKNNHTYPGCYPGLRRCCPIRGVSNQTSSGGLEITKQAKAGWKPNGFLSPGHRPADMNAHNQPRPERTKVTQLCSFAENNSNSTLKSIIL